jgi:hypothetical protein
MATRPGFAVAPPTAGSSARPIAVAAAVLAPLALLVVSALAVLGGFTVGGEAASGAGGQADGVSALALHEIPAPYLQLYEAAAARYGLDWAILAGIGKVECDHGQAPAPSCTQEGVVNSAGAGGPMQFLASTWAVYGVSAAGDGPPDRWNPADAIYSAANYLRAAGAPANYEAAIYAYNHAHWYVVDVEAWAGRYRGSARGAATALAGGRSEGADLSLASETATPVRFIEGERAALDPHDGHVALIPAGVPPVVQALLVGGNELQDLPYGPAGHPDPLGASQEDCSSTVNYVLYRAGLRPLAEILARNPLAQDYVDWGAPGPGRWVTIYAAAAPVPHVFIVIAGLRLDTSHDGTDVGPNRDENGPRWRILSYIPTWEHWSVRHPRGL